MFSHWHGTIWLNLLIVWLFIRPICMYQSLNTLKASFKLSQISIMCSRNSALCIINFKYFNHQIGWFSSNAPDWNSGYTWFSCQLDSGYPVWGISWFSSAPLSKCSNRTLIRLLRLSSKSFPIYFLQSFYHLTLHSLRFLKHHKITHTKKLTTLIPQTTFISLVDKHFFYCIQSEIFF